MENESPAKPAYRGLRILLNVLGVLCLLQGAAAFLPAAWIQAMMDYFADTLGGPQIAPFGPVAWYGIRTLNLVFLGVAWMFFVAAREPERHRDFIHAVILVVAAWLVLCPVFGYYAGMAVLWYIGDSVSALIGLVLLMALYPRRPAAVE